MRSVHRIRERKPIRLLFRTGQMQLYLIRHTSSVKLGASWFIPINPSAGYSKRDVCRCRIITVQIQSQ